MAESAQDLEQQTQALEAYAMQALAAGLSRLAEIESLRSNVSVAAIASIVSPQLLAAHAAADQEFQVFARAIVALQNGTGKLARSKAADGSLVWGVVKVGPELGGWPVVAAILVFVAAGWYLHSLWDSSAKIEATAKKLRAETQRQCQVTVAALLKAGHTSEAAALGQACANAAAAAEAPPPGLLERAAKGLLQVGQGVAAAGVGAGLLWVFAALALSRRGGSSKGWHVRSPVQFHKPVSFHKPYRDDR